ncbi:HD domain-containing protein [Streptomyces bambusae]|uniref:HD domain-containing protein n=1 Tax=Streptomyces bambusae TaxID=1550616 RepID=UPI001CFCBE1A|nr:HD domain-containing protein [Streptomyces bambusae]MCB5164557.1 HD domain-containing protein [Streptomyces bambusae]
MADETAKDTAAFLFEMGVMKNAKRTGWWFTGNNNPESIADHSFRVGIIGAVLAMMEGADPAKVALMCLFHDTQETRIGDIPHIGRRYIDVTANVDVTADQVARAHPAVRAGVLRVVEEYEAGNTPEAIVAKDADKLECLVQAVEYRSQGNTLVQDWIDTSLNSLKTASARELADAALNMSPLEWRNKYLGQ